MSRGPGRVQKILMGLFTDDPSALLDTSELCKAVYGVAKVDKRHRVAVLRALKRLAETRMPHLARRVLEFEKASDVWFDARTVQPLPSTSARAKYPRPARSR